MKPLTPPLKWAGGKRWLVPTLRKWYEPHRSRRLVEPFAGGLAVALGLLPERALLMDANPHAIHFYQWLQRGLVVERPMQNDRAAYDAARARFNELTRLGEDDSSEAAGLFYYLNRTGFNGLCRFNRRGEFNVPFGRYKTITYRTDFREYTAALAPWRFECGDFEETRPVPDDFVYADPPYDVEFRQYSRGGFEWKEQERLAKWLSLLPGPVVASNQATPRVMDLYRSLGFRCHVVHGPRRISCDGDRTPAQEMLATRNLPEAVLEEA